MTADNARKRVGKYHRDSSVYADLRMKKSYTPSNSHYKKLNHIKGLFANYKCVFTIRNSVFA